MTNRAWLLAATLLAGACVESKPPVAPTPVDTTVPVAAAPTPAPSAEPAAPSAAPAPVDTSPRETPPDVTALRLLRDAQGGVGLMAELKRLPTDPGKAFAFQKLVLDLVRDLNDPGAADALAAFAAQKPHPYFETRAAQALAQLGDLRAVPFLARRLRLDPLTVYGENDWELRLKRTDNERVVSARLLGDLAVIHPEARATTMAQAEDAIWFWLKEQPAPHANGMRALASLESQKDRAQLREWSDPKIPLPKPGEQPPMPMEWVIAQSALRYVGKLHDAPSFPVLVHALERRPKTMDTSMNGLMSGGVAILGMSLRAIGMGAADGLAEWGDSRAFKPLLKYVEDPLNNEQSRLNAGSALGWVGSNQDLQQLAKRVARAAPPATQDPLLRMCFFEALDARPAPGVAAELLPLLDPAQPVEIRGRAARVLGRQRLDAATESQLTARLQTPDVKVDVTVALLLGGSKQAAVNAIESFGKVASPSVTQLKDSLGSALSNLKLSTDDVANGTLFRYVENAEAVAAVLLRREPQVFVRVQLGSALQNLIYDNGPHSATRVVLDDQLRRVARGGDARLAKLAVRSFLLLNEAGHLLDLSRGKGPVADAARDAYRELLVINAAKPDVPLYE